MSTDSKAGLPAKAEIEVLTWLRGLAALVVVISHLVRATEVSYGGQDEPSRFWLFNALDLGSLGVAVFFVLSGCTLYLSNARLEYYKAASLGGFYLKRFFRIWPAFAVSLVAYALFRIVFQATYGLETGNWVEHQFLAEAGTSDVFRYLALIFNVTGPSGLFNNAYWSLPVEFQFYVLFPLLLASIRYAWLVGPVVLAGVAYLAQRQGWVALHSNLVLTLLFTFSAGMILGYLYTRSSLRLPTWLALVLALLGVTVASLVSNGIVAMEWFVIIPSEWVLYGLVGIALVAVLLFSSCRLPVWLQPPLMKLGEISYSLYLYHNLAIGLAVVVMLGVGVTSGEWRLVTVSLIAVPLSLVLALVSYRWVESPSIRIGRYLSRAVSRPSLAQASANP